MTDRDTPASASVEEKLRIALEQNEKLVGVIKEARTLIAEFRRQTIAEMASEQRGRALQLAVWYGGQDAVRATPAEIVTFAEHWLSWMEAPDADTK